MISSPRRLGAILLALAVPLGVRPAAGDVAPTWNELALRRAAALLQEGDPAGAAEVLAERDSLASGVRADFLQAWAARAAGDAEGVRAALARLADSHEDPAEWARILAALDAARRPAGLVPEGDAPAGSVARHFDLDVTGTAGVARAAGVEATRARRVSITDGLRALQEGRMEDARRILQEAEASWQVEDDALAALLDPSDSLVADLFRDWERGGAGERSVVLDVAPLEESLADHARAAWDLRRTPQGDLTPPRRLTAVLEGPAGIVPPPAAADRRAADAWAAALDSLRLETVRDRRRLALADAAARRAGDYYGIGRHRTDAEARSLDATLARLDELIAQSSAMLAKLRAARNEETRRIAERTARFLETCRKNLIVARALVRFRTEGAAARRPEVLPPDVPAPARLLAEEAELCAAMEAWLTAFAARAPELLARSFEEIWEPRLTAGLLEMADRAASERERARQLAAAIDAARTDALDAAGRRALLARIEANEAAAARAADSLRAERRRVVVASVTAARAAHHRAAEGMRYGAAAATHELAIRTEGGEALRAEAQSRYEAFLEAYPASRARSEVRFRLADALLAGAREDFAVQMQRFLGEAGAATEGDAKAFAPFVDYQPALAIYLGLLEEDPGFAHRDAVLYHAGMILHDQADLRGLELLGTLVAEHPASAHAQESHLVLGDDRFARKDFAGALAHYDAAASGPDPEHTAIALYHAGWARFNRDDFEGAAGSFRRLVDLYAQRPDAARTTDLRDEAEDHLVQSLARAGGADPFARLFPAEADVPLSPRVLARLGDLYRDYSRFDEAAACDRAWMARWPRDAGALAHARKLADTLERAERPDAAREERLALAPRFRRGSDWWNANDTDSLRADADTFARGAYVAAALHRHEAARADSSDASWQAAAGHYATLLEGWPAHGSVPAWRYGAGEAAFSLGRFGEAVELFEGAAASDTASFRADASWQAVAARDAWYERERATRGADAAAGPAELAKALNASIDGFVAAHPADARVADLLWRQAHVARAQGWNDEAVRSFDVLASTHPEDPRALDAARLSAQLLVDGARFREAGDAYARAARIATAAGQDSLAAELALAVPSCAYREAEAVAGKRGDGAESARLFEDVAARWPAFEGAPRALYRGGAGWLAAGETADAVRVWSQLAQLHPDDELARDALLRTAQAWKDAGRSREAARASERFALAYPDDPDAGPALLDAAELAAAAGDSADAERLEDAYMAKHPEDAGVALSVLERRARREIDGVTPQRPVSLLLAAPAPAAPKGKGAAAAVPASALQRWLDLAADHPETASVELAARVKFLQAEETRSRYERVTLTQPLAPAIAQKKSLLENALQDYRECAAREIAPWNRAAAARIGECLVGFGDALKASERPADLSGDDLAAYEEEIDRQSWEFFDRGEEVWTQLVRRAGESPGDVWVERAQQELWPRVARRFTHRPEVDYPLVPEAASSGDASQP